MWPRRPAAVSDVDPGARPARLRAGQWVADDAARLRLFRQLETDGFLNLGIAQSGPLETAAIGLETGVKPDVSPKQAPGIVVR